MAERAEERTLKNVIAGLVPAIQAVSDPAAISCWASHHVLLCGDPMLYYIYILASRRNGTLYVGVTNDLVRRVHEHREGAVAGFTKRYGVKTLVHFESTEDIRVAIQREKNIKKWPRRWKLRLIEEHNPGWADLYPSIL